jgi:hypothetical protein
MAIPPIIDTLVADLEARGFVIKTHAEHDWPRGGEIELARRNTRGVSAVRLLEDRGVWEVSVKIGRSWYNPHTSLVALQDRPHAPRAMSHEDWLRSTVELVDRFSGDRADKAAIKARHREVNRAYNRWAQGKSHSPYG